MVLVAGHSGTLYDIFEDLGIDTSNDIDFPRDEDGKVRDFGDIWKIVINTNSGAAHLAWRKNLDFGPLRVH